MAKSKTQQPPEGVLEIQYKRIREDEKCPEPVKLHGADAAFDLLVTRYTTVAGGGKAQLPHNLAVAIPPGYYGLIIARSSTFTKKGLLIQPGVIDAGYRGEVQTMAYNPTSRMVHIGDGERLSQLLILPIVAVEFAYAKRDLPSGDRGSDGFGSTGGFSN